MLIDLIAFWKNGTLPKILDENKEAKPPIVPQSSFQFETPPTIIFVKEINKRTIARQYRDLPSVPLLPEEQKLHAEARQKIQEASQKNPRAYNGNHILLTGAVYDTASNILYLEAVRVDYAFVSVLNNMRALKLPGSALTREFYKTGVLAPFVSCDDQVSIITRKDAWSLRSVAAGFLEVKEDKAPLSHLVQRTAWKEAHEEFALDKDKHPRFDFMQHAWVASVSFREVVGMPTPMPPTIEFVAPLKVKQDAGFIRRVMNQNEAPDAHEHVPNSTRNIPLDRIRRADATAYMREKAPGGFLFGPIIHACAVLANPEMLFAHLIPEIPTSRFYPIGVFKPTPRRALMDPAEENMRRYLEEKQRLSKL